MQQWKLVLLSSPNLRATLIRHLTTLVSHSHAAHQHLAAGEVHRRRKRHHNRQPQNKEEEEEEENPYELMKDDPIQACADIWVRAFSIPVRKRRPFRNLAGYLKSFGLWVLAYQRACAHHTGSFPPRHAIHFPDLRSLLSLRRSFLSPRRPYPWGTAFPDLLHIRSPSDPPLPLSNRKLQAFIASAPPPFQDRVAQELLLLVLEPIFECRFSPRSMAFRPGRTPHTVLRTLRSSFAGYLWFIKIDLTALACNFSPDVIIKCLQKGVADGKVLSLIRSALEMPVRSLAMDGGDENLDPLTRKRMKRNMLRSKRKKKILNEKEPKPDPYWLRTFFSFSPEEAAWIPNYGHCGILSPLLANVCLHELDCWLEKRLAKYFCPSKLDSIWNSSMNDGCHNPTWPEFVPSSGHEKTRRMDFVRYGAHVLIGIRGPRGDAVELKKDLVGFCETKYGMRLNSEAIEIEHISRGIEFLDHVICRQVVRPTLRYTSSGGKVVNHRGIGTMLSVTASIERCITRFRRIELVKGDRNPEPLPCSPMLYSGQAHTNSQMNKFLETMADWYKYADNRKRVVAFCAYVIRSSLAKLYAARYRLKSRAKVYKIATRDLSLPLKETTQNNAPEFSDLLRMGLVDAIEGVQFAHMSSIPSCDYSAFPKQWMPDHERILHEYVRLQSPEFFYELSKSVKGHDLTSPQDYIAKMIWEYKVFGVLRKRTYGNNNKSLLDG